MNRSKLKVLGAFAAVFLLGGVTGGATMHVVDTRRTIDMFDAASQGSRHGVFLWSLERKLDLSPQQRGEFEQIMAQYDRDVAAAMVPVDPRAKELRKKMRAELRAKLTPAQQARYDELMTTWDAARRRSRPDVGKPAGSGAPAPSNPIDGP
jgi:hypothetical protein